VVACQQASGGTAALCCAAPCTTRQPTFPRYRIKAYLAGIERQTVHRSPCLAFKNQYRNPSVLLQPQPDLLLVGCQ
jgi:hypothetical protein